LKRLVILSLSVGTAALAAATTTAADKPSAVTAAPAKLTLCHKTASGSWQRLTVSSRTAANPNSNAGRLLRSHLRHSGDAIIAGPATCPSVSLTPAATPQAPARVTICHRTGSASNPYRRITVSSRALANPRSTASNVVRGHLRHTGDIVMPGAPACPSAAPAAGAGQGGASLEATLTAVQGASGSGTFSARVQMGRGQLCYTLTVTGLANLTGAHIHRASTGAIVVPLTTPTGGSSSGCVTVERSLLQEILASPAAFYVNVHTTTLPGGHVQGTLRR
jgi:hypothetical protein